MATTVFQIWQVPTSFYGLQLLLLRRSLRALGCMRKGGIRIRCAFLDLIGGDQLKFDLGQRLEDVEKQKALTVYSTREGGYESRYLTWLRYQGFYFQNLSARGLGDPETTITKIHLPIARRYYPPEIDYRLSLLPLNNKGLVPWVIELILNSSPHKIASSFSSSCFIRRVMEK
ncbi:NAD(P)H-quinone oxidoreductase subunit N [Nymphaea thermarum]|nr:NAD(P)H-quinone oxidoreductase subunit N [Nymphaea thermarum]